MMWMIRVTPYKGMPILLTCFKPFKTRQEARDYIKTRLNDIGQGICAVKVRTVYEEIT